MSQTPVVSIIIPTHNRRQLLMQNLSALSGQTYAATDFEVLVVADSCADDTAAFVRAYASQTPFRLRLLQHSAKSAAATRNLGASHAEGAIFLFLDDDVIAQPDFVRVHVEAQFEDSVVLGYSKPMLSRRPSWWQYDARRWWEDTFREMANPGHRFSYRNFFSGNVSMAASLFQRVNGFDMSFTGRLEDYELGVRLLKAGARFCYVPAAIGYHYDNTDLARWLRRIRQEGVADVQIGQRHPELRALMFGDLSEPPEWTLATIRRIAFAFPALGDMLERRMLGVATLCEQLKLRYRWQQILRALREYNYWRGVATAIGTRSALSSWMQEGPVPSAPSNNVPTIDMVRLPSATNLQEILSHGTNLGLRLLLDGVEIMTLAPDPGAEPLREEHLHHKVQQLAQYQFVPALALNLARSMQGNSYAD